MLMALVVPFFKFFCGGPSAESRRARKSPAIYEMAPQERALDEKVPGYRREGSRPGTRKSPASMPGDPVGLSTPF